MSLPPSSPWEPYTTTLGATQTNPTPGSSSSLTAYQMQLGKLLFVTIQFAQTGAGSAGSGTYLFTLPIGYPINTDVTGILSSVSPYNYSVIGSCHAIVQGQANASGNVILYDATRIVLGIGKSQSAYLVGSTLYPLSTANLRYSIRMTIPLN
jgi:hypothetical protein